MNIKNTSLLIFSLVNFFEQKDMDCEVDKYPFKVRDGMGGSYGYELKYSCKDNL